MHGKKQYIIVSDENDKSIIVKNFNRHDYDGDVVTVSEMKGLFPRFPGELLAMSMKNLSRMKNKDGYPYDPVKIGWTQDYAALYARTGIDFQKIAGQLQAKGWIKFNGSHSLRITTEHTRSVQLDKVGIEITDAGWEEIKRMTANETAQISETMNMTNKIFVVHGHDLERRDEIELFIRRIGLEPIILEQQASSGKTVIEKFEDEAKDTKYAIIILTPDDIGCAIKDTGKIKDMENVTFKSGKCFEYRARQNAYFEYGFFAGKLGRDRVSALAFGDIKWPTDISGIVYASESNWKQELFRNLEKAGYACKTDGILS